MKIEVKNITEFGLVKMLDCLHSSIVCLDVEGGPRYLVAPGLKKIKETKQKHSYPCFKVAAVDFSALDRAFLYYGYTMD